MFGPRGKWPAWEHAGRIPFACRKGLLSLGFWKQCVPSVLMDCKLPCTRCPFPRITDCISSASLCLLGWRGRWNVNFLQGISYEPWWSLCFLHHLSASSQSSSSLLTWTQPLQTSFDSSCKLVVCHFPMPGISFCYVLLFLLWSAPPPGDTSRGLSWVVSSLLHLVTLVSPFLSCTGFLWLLVS